MKYLIFFIFILACSKSAKVKEYDYKPSDRIEWSKTKPRHDSCYTEYTWIEYHVLKKVGSVYLLTSDTAFLDSTIIELHPYPY